MVLNKAIIYIIIVNGIFLAVPLLFFTLYTKSRAPEREKDKDFKDERKREARSLT